MKWLSWTLLALFVAAIAAAAFALHGFQTWRAGLVNNLDRDVRIADLPSGKMEYAVRGNGSPILALHGSPGGYDQGVLIGHPLSSLDFEILAPSRPGYLQTPLSTGITFYEQANACAELLRQEGIDRALIVAFGPSCAVATLFAKHFPDKVSGLVLISPVMMPLRPKDAAGRFYQLWIRGGPIDLQTWLLWDAVENGSRGAIAEFLEQEPGLAEEAGKLAAFVTGSPTQRKWLQDYLETLVPARARLQGFTNDTIQITANLDWFSTLPQKPILCIYGMNDADAPHARLQELAVKNPQLELAAVEGAGQLIWVGPNADTAVQKLIDFCRRHDKAPAR